MLFYILSCVVVTGVVWLVVYCITKKMEVRDLLHVIDYQANEISRLRRVKRDSRGRFVK